MKNYVQKGDTLTIPAPYAVVSGGGVKAGSIFGIAAGAAEEAAEVDISTVGVFDLVKVAANSFTLGAAVYFDDTAKLATSTASGNTKIGVCVEAAAADTAAVRVRLNGSF